MKSFPLVAVALRRAAVTLPVGLAGTLLSTASIAADPAANFDQLLQRQQRPTAAAAPAAAAPAAAAEPAIRSHLGLQPATQVGQRGECAATNTQCAAGASAQTEHDKPRGQPHQDTPQRHASQRHAPQPQKPHYNVRAANQSFSGEPALTCRSVQWKQGDIVRLQAQLHKQVHVTLPENGIDVIMGDKELWALDWIRNQIFLKPTSQAAEGLATTITAIGQSGNAYEFVVHRIRDNAEVSHCVQLSADLGLAQRAQWNKPTDREQELGTALGREIAQLRERNAQLEQQGREELKNYRKNIHSDYQWNTGGVFSRWDGPQIESVYDDGRFTYVRIKDEGGTPLASISAEVDGQAQLLEYSYDSATKVYQVSGIFPKFVMRSGRQSLDVARGAK
jgi:type IV secretory pathway VirB9-like protein